MNSIPIIDSITRNIRQRLSIICILMGLFGVVALADAMATYCIQVLEPNELFTVNKYLQEYFWYPNKPMEMARYCFSVAALMAYCSWIVFLYRTHTVAVKSFFQETATTNLFGYAFFWFICNLILSLANGEFYYQVIEFFILPWIALLHWPYFNQYVYKSNEILSSGRIRKISYISIFVFLAQIIYIYHPFILFKPKLLNELLAIPEKTLLWKSSKISGDPSAKLTEPIEVDNSSYLLEHQLYSPIAHIDDPSSGGKSISIPGIPISRSIPIDEFIENNTATTYDNRTGRLYIVTPIGPSALDSLYRLMKTEDQKSALLTQAAEMQKFCRTLTEKKFSPQELEFIANNKREIQEQTLNRFILHHHAHIFSPLNDLELGRPISETHFLYGFLNTWITERSLLALHGDVTFQGYSQFYFSFYIIYAVMYLGTCLLIFRNLLMTSVAILVAALVGTAVGFDEIMLGPGGNPIRHIFDLPVILCVWFAVKGTGRNAVIWWISAFIISWASMFNNREFGLFLSISGIVCLGWFTIIERSGSKRVALLLTMAIALVITYIFFHFASIGAEGYSKYFLKGVDGFPFMRWRMIVAVSACGIIAWLLLSNWLNSDQKVSPKVKLMCFLAIHFFLQLTYYVWFPANAHIFTILPQFALLAVLIIEHLSIRFERINMRIPIFTGLLLIIAFLDIIVLVRYQKQKMQFNKIFASHHTYDWDFPRMQIKTTMDPAPFKSSIEMIHRLAPNPGIHILSKYDMILPFISNHFSEMQFHEIGNFMITQVETEKVIDEIRHDKPDVLFVDSDIKRPNALDIIPPVGPFGYLYDESHWRALRLGLLGDIFNQIRDDYELAESGPLISAWRRKSSSLKQGE